MDRCKGVEDSITPKLIELVCPKCGADLEMFSIDEKVVCECGHIVYNENNAALSLGAINDAK
jgi:hypothetical protein